jgi:hypothetical protein
VIIVNKKKLLIIKKTSNMIEMIRDKDRKEEMTKMTEMIEMKDMKEKTNMKDLINH